MSGAASAGSLLGASCSAREQNNKTEKQSLYRSPGRDETLVRDLTPGSTPIRLACSDLRLNYPEKESITETVRRIRDAGYTSATTPALIGKRNRWLDAGESDIAELKEALWKYDVTAFDVMVRTTS